MTGPLLQKVTIMIPTYNQEAFIAEAVNSALMQTYPNLEVVVGDDASTDATFSIVSRIKDCRLKLVRNPQNLGRTANYRNIFYNHASGDFVVNLDGDDYYTDPEFIAEAVKMIGNDPSVVMVQARARWTSSNRRHVSRIPDEEEMSGMEILANMPERKFFFMHMACLYKRRIALELDFYRYGVISSDWESLFRLSLRGRVKFLNRVVGVWRIHGGNETSQIGMKSDVENLEIWPSIYSDAVELGMNSLKAKILSCRCMAFFASMFGAGLSRLGNRKQIDFLIYLFRNHPWVLAWLLAHPFYFARIVLGVCGYYRWRRGKAPAGAECPTSNDTTTGHH
ncbi:glycosyltransferase, group 2 family protein [delta proteobacterium NaphS2]|nr:glycosyltransferase, group 2 family protein [delta proteobacterium NaphS2]